MSKRRTQDEWVAEATVTHSGRYNYSKSCYVDNNTKVIIVCEKHGDFYQTPLAHINHKQGCPYCHGKILNGHNSLQDNFPLVAKMWHPNKNGLLTPKDVVAKGAKKVWWKCPASEDHEWQDSSYSRVKIYIRNPDSNNCPFCSKDKLCQSNCLAILYPELASEWHSIKNENLTPHDVIGGGNTKIWWQCPVAKDHEWIAIIRDRISGHGCPCCSKPIKKIVPSNCLQTTHPHLVEFWHPKNTVSIMDVSYGSSKKVWWKCPVAEDHEYESEISYMAENVGCPCCYGIKVVNSNCLATLYPDMALEWHPSKNGKLNPFNVFGGGHTKFWWKCNIDGYEWKTTISSRISNDSGCRICNESKGEKAIVDILNKNKLKFDREVLFDSCKHKNCLRFDFLVKTKNNKVLIEYNGEHHYKPIKRSKNMTNEIALRILDAVKIRDSIKQEWSKKEKIPLLVIPYWEKDNMDQIILNFIEVYK